MSRAKIKCGEPGQTPARTRPRTHGSRYEWGRPVCRVCGRTGARKTARIWAELDLESGVGLCRSCAESGEEPELGNEGADAE
jgi:hypothetical protein